KAFTGQVLASLAADGVVNLADPLTKYVPDFIAPLSEGGRPIRLVDLATHSAGLPREVPHALGPPGDPFANITREAFVAWLKANPLLFTPGTSVLYSNFGFDLLAAALSAAARKPYPDLIAERVLKPLGLDDTTFTLSGDQTARLMRGHDFDGAPLPYALTGSVIVGSGGLYSPPRGSSTTPPTCGATASTRCSAWTSPATWTRWASAGSSCSRKTTARSSCRRPAACRESSPTSPSRRPATSVSWPRSTRSTSTRASRSRRRRTT